MKVLVEYSSLLHDMALWAERFQLDLQSDQVSVNDGSSEAPNGYNDKGESIKRSTGVSGSRKEFTDIGKELVEN